MALTPRRWQPGEPGDGLEIGISRYDSFTAEKDHYHKWNTEYNYVIKGSVKVVVFNEKKEYELKENDMYVITCGMSYVTKAQPGTEVLFVKSPGGNDKKTLKENKSIGTWSKDWDAKMDFSVELSKSISDTVKDFIQAAKEPVMKKITKFFSFVREAFIHALRFFVFIFGIFAAGWGVFNYVISDEAKKQNVLILFIIVILSLVLIVFVIRLIGVIIGRMTVRLVGKNKVTIRRDDYQNNMDWILRGRHGMQLDRFAFVMGIDRTGKLDISSTGGVIHSVLQYLNVNYRCFDDEGIIIKEGNGPQIFIQKVLNDYMAKKKTLAYGECVSVHLRLQSKKTVDQTSIIPCHLILIANSRKIDKNNDDNMSDDNTSSIIVPCVFNYLLKRNINVEEMMIGVMGTNGMKQQYKVVFSQIINQFARYCYDEMDKKRPKHLFISFREEDYSKGDNTLSQLERYVRQCSRYYPKRVTDN